MVWKLSMTDKFQSTHPHGVRLERHCELQTTREHVSIHAPARGATQGGNQQVLFVTVSIHAPARGATFFAHPLIMPVVFQSTHPHGVRLQCVVHLADIGKFQSTHPHGVRLGWMMRNPRRVIVSIHAPARGATTKQYNTFRPVKVSIHAPARGATNNDLQYWQYFRSFNPRTRTGCDSLIASLKR